jgi:hypothetical protein
VKRHLVRTTAAGTHWRFTSGADRAWDVEILIPLESERSDAAGFGWVAQVNGYQVFPGNGAYWATEDEALDAAEAWIMERAQ